MHNKIKIHQNKHQDSNFAAGLNFLTHAQPFQELVADAFLIKQWKAWHKTAAKAICNFK